MIYRILCNDRHLAPSAQGTPAAAGRLRGAWVAGVEGFRMKPPKRVTNERIRFYFTEQGWREVGRGVAANARREGRTVKVIRRKNPEASQVVYRDALQVAILPRKERGAKGEE